MVNLSAKCSAPNKEFSTTSRMYHAIIAPLIVLNALTQVIASNVTLTTSSKSDLMDRLHAWEIVEKGGSKMD